MFVRRANRVCTGPYLQALSVENGYRYANILDVKLYVFSFPSILTHLLGAQKNRLTEMVLLSMHIIYFVLERRFNFQITHYSLEA